LISFAALSTVSIIVGNAAMAFMDSTAPLSATRLATDILAPGT